MSVLKTFAYVSGMTFEDFCFKPKKYIYKYIVKNIDWPRSNQELAEELKHPASDISHFRVILRRMGYKIQRSSKAGTALTPRAKEFIRAGLGKITDSEIGRKFGVTRERVRQIRNKCGVKLNKKVCTDATNRANKALNEKKWRSLGTRFYKMYKDGVGKCEIKKTLRLGVGGFSFLEKIYGVKFPKRNKWLNLVNRIDWTTSNKILGRKFNVHPRVVSRYRKKFREMGYDIPKLAKFGRGIEQCTAQAI